MGPATKEMATGSLLGVFVLALAFRQSNGHGAFVGLIGGMTVVEAEPTRDGGPAGLAGPLGATHPSSTWIPVPVAHIARDPLDPALDEAALLARVRSRKTGVKRALLDQGLLSGVGNIYADEALFRAGIHPLRPAGALRPAQLEALREGIEDALAAGIEAKGATIDDFRHLDGAYGSFQEQFLVHLREGQSCVRCSGPIRKLVVGGRGTYVCERCQPRPRRRIVQRRPLVAGPARPERDDEGLA